MTTLKTMPVKPEYLRTTSIGRPVGVDRNKECILGMCVAQLGPFKSEGRGEFNEEALAEIVRLGNAERGGLKSRFTHPDLSSDGLGKFLGRATNFSMSTARDARTKKEVKAVRADLKFDKSAHETPSGDLAKYVMDLAESDPDALSSSLVLKPDQKYRIKEDGTREQDKDGNDLPPLWFPLELHATDIVDVGDAVDGLLSANLSTHQLASALTDGITPEIASALKFDNVVRLGSQMLDALFQGQPRDVVEARCKAYFERYLIRKYGEQVSSVAEVVVAPPRVPDTSSVAIETPRLNKMLARLSAMGATAGKVKPKV